MAASFGLLKSRQQKTQPTKLILALVSAPFLLKEKFEEHHGSLADGLEPSQATLALLRRVQAPSLPCSLSGGGRCRRGMARFAPGCSAPCGVRWVPGRTRIPAWVGEQAWGCESEGLSVKLGLCRWEQKVL